MNLLKTLFMLISQLHKYEPVRLVIVRGAGKEVNGQVQVHLVLGSELRVVHTERLHQITWLPGRQR